MTKVAFVPAPAPAPQVVLTLSANQAHAVLNFLNQFFIPKSAKSGLASVREQLRNVGTTIRSYSTYKGVPTISSNRGTKKYRIG